MKAKSQLRAGLFAMGLSLLALGLTIGTTGCGGGSVGLGGGGGNPGPSITGLSPTSGVVGTPVTIIGANFGATQVTSTVTFNGTVGTPTSWSATNIVVSVPIGATTGNVVVTVGGLASNGMGFIVSSGGGSAMGPLVQSSTNPNYFVDKNGKAVLLTGSQTWNSFQNLGSAGAVTTMDFTGFVSFLAAHGHNATIFRKRELPQYCGWGAGGTWIVDSATGYPWPRTGPGTASDGLLKFDLSKFNQPFFDRLHALALQMSQSGIYVIVQLFDGLDLVDNRCGTTTPTGDGYPFTGINNINSVDDGYTNGATGSASMTTAPPNAFTTYQVAYIQKMVDTVNDLPNVIWEISEEAPVASAAWNAYMIGQLQSYEATKPLKHPILYPTLNLNQGANDSTLYNSNADAVAPRTEFPMVGGNCGTGSPKCKVVINDSDHSYFGMWNDTQQTNRQFIWQNFTNGFNVVFQDPYLIYWPSQGRNLCDNGVVPAHGVCATADPRWENFRGNLGQLEKLASNKLDLIKMTAQPSLASTGFCLADNVATGGEFVVYAPNGGQFTVNLSKQNGRTMNVQWFDPTKLSFTSPTPYPATSSATQSFNTPWGNAYDAVLYLVDASGHN